MLFCLLSLFEDTSVMVGTDYFLLGIQFLISSVFNIPVHIMHQ